jgi:hypothetical protein
MSRNLEALTSPEPSGPHRPVMGLLYLFYFFFYNIPIPNGFRISTPADGCRSSWQAENTAYRYWSLERCLSVKLSILMGVWNVSLVCCFKICPIGAAFMRKYVARTWQRKAENRIRIFLADFESYGRNIASEMHVISSRIKGIWCWNPTAIVFRALFLTLSLKFLFLCLF